eukprot:TRINITY_DN1522_c0_g1_i6.p1 TRINITY_DN1522_c0_g1~~TRINITY_DN1522_c0_g1_i6.p1  ORF type:complete len:252 (-),score=-15.13 TRINITY_DN1522_c0_g1_i6:136-891(-)
MQEYNLARLLCHLCKRFCVPGSFIPCKTPCCGKLFCNKCLTSQYKYSKSKVSRLPTPMWRCPVCTKKCKCDECCELFKIPRKRHGKRRTAAGKSDSTKSKLSTSGRAATNFYSRADANTVTPLGDKGTHEVLSPAAKRHLPSISCSLGAQCSISGKVRCRAARNSPAKLPSLSRSICESVCSNDGIGIIKTGIASDLLTNDINAITIWSLLVRIATNDQYFLARQTQAFIEKIIYYISFCSFYRSNFLHHT